METLNCEEKYGFPSMMATGWSDLRQTLVDWLPIDTVQLGKQFTSLEQHHDHAVVHFADGSHAKAQIIIGADGVFSKVRRQNLADGPPDFTVKHLWLFACTHIQAVWLCCCGNLTGPNGTI